MPCCLREKNARVVGRTMVCKGGEIVPRFYFRWGGIWEHVPEDLRVKIRQYCA